MERKMVERDLTGFDTNHYLAWSNTLAKTLAKLGIDSPRVQPPDAEPEPPTADLAAYLAARAPNPGPGAAL